MRQDFERLGGGDAIPHTSIMVKKFFFFLAFFYMF